MLNLPAGEAPSLELRSNGEAISLRCRRAGGRAGEPRRASAAGLVSRPCRTSTARAVSRSARTCTRFGTRFAVRCLSAADRERRAAGGGGRQAPGPRRQSVLDRGVDPRRGRHVHQPSPSSPPMARRWTSRMSSGSEGPTSRSSSARPGRTYKHGFAALFELPPESAGERVGRPVDRPRGQGRRGAGAGGRPQRAARTGAAAGAVHAGAAEQGGAAPQPPAPGARQAPAPPPQLDRGRERGRLWRAQPISRGVGRRAALRANRLPPPPAPALRAGPGDARGGADLRARLARARRAPASPRRADPCASRRSRSGSRSSRATRASPVANIIGTAACARAAAPAAQLRRAARPARLARADGQLLRLPRRTSARWGRSCCSRTTRSSTPGVYFEREADRGCGGTCTTSRDFTGTSRRQRHAAGAGLTAACLMIDRDALRGGRRPAPRVHPSRAATRTPTCACGCSSGPQQLVPARQRSCTTSRGRLTRRSRVRPRCAHNTWLQTELWGRPIERRRWRGTPTRRLSSYSAGRWRSGPTRSHEQRQRFSTCCTTIPPCPGGAEAYALELYEALRDSDEFEPLLVARIGPHAGPPPSAPRRAFSRVDEDPNQYFIYTDAETASTGSTGPHATSPSTRMHFATSCGRTSPTSCTSSTRSSSGTTWSR